MNDSDTLRRDRAISLAGALAIHAAALIGGTFWVSPVEYGVEAGDGGMEVHLVAALPAALAGQVASAHIQSPGLISAAPEALPPVLDPIAQPALEEQKEPPSAKPLEPDEGQPAIVNPTPYVGDGSSLVPGKEATTYHASGGAKANTGPGYFRNPAPDYPAEARKSGYEGTVLLRAEIMPNGRCSQLEVVRTSGYAILDEAAAQAIRRWRFKPARRAGVLIASWVEIPVRFDLMDPGEGR